MSNLVFFGTETNLGFYFNVRAARVALTVREPAITTTDRSHSVLLNETLSK